MFLFLNLVRNDVFPTISATFSKEHMPNNALLRPGSRSQLEIEFGQAATSTLYCGVPARVHQELMAADSHGHYFAKRIRDRYPYRKL